MVVLYIIDIQKICMKKFLLEDSIRRPFKGRHACYAFWMHNQGKLDRQGSNFWNQLVPMYYKVLGPTIRP